jgi:hypothetical protein
MRRRNLLHSRGYEREKIVEFSNWQQLYIYPAGYGNICAPDLITAGK